MHLLRGLGRRFGCLGTWGFAGNGNFGFGFGGSGRLFLGGWLNVGLNAGLRFQISRLPTQLRKLLSQARHRFRRLFPANNLRRELLCLFFDGNGLRLGNDSWLFFFDLDFRLGNILLIGLLENIRNLSVRDVDRFGRSFNDLLFGELVVILKDETSPTHKSG